MSVDPVVVVTSRPCLSPGSRHAWIGLDLEDLLVTVWDCEADERFNDLLDLAVSS